jgi:Tfp pilus assembly protein PilO
MSSPMRSRVCSSRECDMAFIQVYKTYLTRAAIVWAVSQALCLLAYVIVLRPQYNAWRRLEGTLAEQKQIYASAQKATQEQSKMELANQIQHLRDQMSHFVIDRKQLPDLTFDISQIANEKNLTLQSVATRTRTGAGRGGLSSDTDADHLSEHHIDVKFSAGFLQFAAFVNALERHKPVLFVDQFEIARSKRDDSLYQVSLDVAALVRQQPDKQTDDAASVSTLSAKL